MRNYLQLVTESAKYFGKSPDKLGVTVSRSQMARDPQLQPVGPRPLNSRLSASLSLVRHGIAPVSPLPQSG
jgi:hypothetical protein